MGRGVEYDDAHTACEEASARKSPKDVRVHICSVGVKNGAEESAARVAAP